MCQMSGMAASGPLAEEEAKAEGTDKASRVGASGRGSYEDESVSVESLLLAEIGTFVFDCVVVVSMVSPLHNRLIQLRMSMLHSPASQISRRSV